MNESSALNTYENKVIESVNGNDMKAFRLNIAKLRIFYSSGLESEKTYLMHGLYLMHLLAINDLPLFHLHLAEIDDHIQKNNPLITTPMLLEKYLVEGVYNKVIVYEKTVPSQYYAGFIRIIAETVRKEIASGIEKAYFRISTKTAASLLLLDENTDQLATFAEKRGWRREGDEFLFDVTVPQSPDCDHGNKSAVAAGVNTDSVVKQNLFYAKQLDAII
ncbi:CSN8/PSMD8/EIF3K family domain-containing protein [Ditylenchus destructor]|nr:CSN8/PSMD8/EIF3K family domain-containing protein [Ditylenchus destructor]